MSRHFVADRLWPVLTVLVVLIAGAAVLEVTASDHEAQALVISIRDGSAVMADDGEAADGDEALPDPAEPVSERHARARVEARRGELDSALDLFEQVVAAHPDSAAVRSDLGYWLLVAGRPEQALVALDEAARLAPGDVRIAINRGTARRRTGDDAGAEQEYRRALEVEPDSGSARIALGSLLVSLDRPDEAVDVLVPATRSGSNAERARALVALGRARLGRGEREQAQSDFRRAIERAPAHAELRVRIARAWLGAGTPDDVERALEVLGRAAQMAPDVPQVFSALGRAHELAGDADQAEADYDHAIRLDPSYRYVRRRLIRLAMDRRDYRQARFHAERLLEDGPDVPHHHFLAGLVAARDGRVDDARRHYHDAIERSDDGYPEAWFNLARLEKGEGNLDDAIAAYEHALELRPGYRSALNNLGLAYEAAGRLEDAEATLRRALSVDPRYAAAWLNLGKLLSGQERFDEAIEAFDHALSIRHDYPEAQLDLGVVFARAGRYDDAIETYRDVIGAHPRYVSAWYNLGLAYESAEREGDALEAFRRALALDDDHVASLSHLAALEARTGSTERAERTYEDLLDHEPANHEARLALADLRRREGDLTGCAREARAALASGAPDPEARRLLSQCRR